MDKKRRIGFRFYTLADFEQEEIYLRKKHNQGWKFKKFIYPGFYVFEKCEPEDVIYQLDFNEDSDQNKLQYIKLFSDCGWEYLFDVNNWSYFRKAAKDADSNETIFNDLESKIEMLQRVVKSKLIPVAIIFALIIVPQLIIHFRAVILGNHLQSIRIFMFIFFLILFVIYVTMFVNFAIRFFKLKTREIK